MAGGGLAAAAEGGGRAREDYGGGVTVPVAVTCLMAASCGLIFGYDIGVSGALSLLAAASIVKCLHIYIDIGPCDLCIFMLLW